MRSARGPSLLLGLTLAACTSPTDEDPTTTSTTTGSSTSTGDPTTTTSTTTPTTGDPDGTSTGTPEVGPDPLPPLTKPVPLTTDERREPTHAVDVDKLYDPRLPADLAQMLIEAYDGWTLAPG